MRQLFIFACTFLLLLQTSCSQTPDEDKAPQPVKIAKNTEGLGNVDLRIKDQPTQPQKSEGPDGRRVIADKLQQVSPVIEDPFGDKNKLPRAEPVVIPPVKKQKPKDQTKQKEKNGSKKLKVKLPPNPGMKKKFEFKYPDKIAGKTLDEWIRQIGSKDPSKVENAIATVVLFGHKKAQAAIYPILKQLDRHTARSPLDISIRVNGANAMGFFFAEGRKVDPEYHKFIKYAVKGLKQMLHSDQVLVKYRAAQALSKIGPRAADTIPTLISATRESSTWEVRHMTVVALGRVARKEKGNPDIPVLDALYTRLNTKYENSSQVRLAAIQALAMLGPPALMQHQKLAREHLEKVASHDQDGMVRIWAHVAVLSMSSKIDSKRVREVSKMLKDPEMLVRIQAAKAIWAMGMEAKSEVDFLKDALDDPEDSVAYWAMSALQTMKRWGTAALPTLKKMAKDKKRIEAIRQMAQQTIDVIEGKAKKKKSEKKDKE